MGGFFDPDRLARTYRDPVALGILLVDLFPIYSVIAFGWDATPLVFLYWLENLVIGAFALARMVAVSVKESPAGLIQMVFIGPFFMVHYGMFCFVHGQFLNVFSVMQTGADQDVDFLSPWGLVQRALDSGPYLETFILAIIALQGFLFIRDFIQGGEYRETSVLAEMGAPYGRIIILHVALFVGMAGLAAMGQPMIGILALILLRALWGVFFTLRRATRLQATANKD